MIDCGRFYQALVDRGIRFFTGVPDSLLKHLCAYITDHAPRNNHVITANEGGAIALACGYFLATGSPALVYMQNSGQGNAINPLTSLADPDVYGIPMLMLIGWRGEPGGKDEPQHLKQGRVTLKLFDALDTPYAILPDNIMEAKLTLDKILVTSERLNMPAALIVRKGTFAPYQFGHVKRESFSLTREEAIRAIVDNLDPSDIVVCTTGKASRELYEYRDALGVNHNSDFLTVGSMGHASLIGLGIALQKPSRCIFCIDGDGAALMHMGGLAIIGPQKVKNFRHIILNNGAHDSVGGQPTAGFNIDFPEIALACGYESAWKVETQKEIYEKMAWLRASQGPALLEVQVKRGARKGLGRPKTSPQENKMHFMEFLSK